MVRPELAAASFAPIPITAFDTTPPLQFGPLKGACATAGGAANASPATAMAAASEVRYMASLLRVRGPAARGDFVKDRGFIPA
jgi:hypothetical protein